MAQAGLHRPGVAVSSYQGGHLEFFPYLVARLREEGCGHVKLFGGGGGVIIPSEIEALQAAGVTRIFSPENWWSRRPASARATPPSSTPSTCPSTS